MKLLVIRRSLDNKAHNCSELDSNRWHGSHVESLFKAEHELFPSWTGLLAQKNQDTLLELLKLIQINIQHKCKVKLVHDSLSFSCYAEGFYSGSILRLLHCANIDKRRGGLWAILQKSSEKPPGTKTKESKATGSNSAFKPFLTQEKTKQVQGLK